MLSQMDDACIFTYLNLLEHLAKSKAAGPDRLPNEVLQALPNKLMEAIGSFFVVMWLVGHKSDSSKISLSTSTSVLLY